VDEEAIAQSFTGGATGVVRSHGWGYGHLAVWAAIAAASVGVEFAILDASEPTLSLGPRAALCGGIALYLLSASAIQRATPRSLRSGVLVARLCVAAICVAAIGVALAPSGAYVSTPVLVAILSLALIGLTAFESSAKEHSTGDDAEEPGSAV
jgi:low temperature requirement protein LtrA